MTDTTWLEAAGLVLVSEGVWQDEATGLEVRVWEASGVPVIRTGTMFCDFVQTMGTLGDRDREAVMGLSERIARAYNEREQP